MSLLGKVKDSAQILHVDLVVITVLIK